MVNAMERGRKYGMMGRSMKAIGKMTNLMDMVLFTIRMEMYTKDIGKIIGQMERGYI